MVFMSEGVSQPEVSVFATKDAVAIRFNLFSECLAATGEIDRDSLVTTAQLWVVMLHGISHHHIAISGYKWQSPEVLIAKMFSLLVDQRPPS
jgi:hypothetical protein